MHYKFLVAGLLVFVASTARSAENAPASYVEIRTPTSPAFALLGITPSSIERPTTPHAFAAALLSASSGSNGVVPENLAIEVAPYWWYHHPDLDFMGYYDGNVYKNILRTLSLSIVTNSKKNEQTGKDDTSLGAGVRFQFLIGKPASGLEEELQKYKTAATELAGLLPLGAGESLPDNPETRAIRARVAEQLNAVRNLDKKRVGFSLDFAAAFTKMHPESKWSNSKTDRVGAWLTPAYRFEAKNHILKDFTFVGVGRFIDDRTARDEYLDFGASIVWHGSKFPVNASFEYLKRETDKSGDTERYAIVVEYVYSEQWSLIASYGKNFKTDLAGDDLIAILGIKLGLGKGPVIPYDSKR